MKIKMIAALSITTAAAALPLAAIAHADQFLAPSGNIGCAMVDQGADSYAVCKVRDHTWVSPDSGGDYCTGAGDMLLMFRGHAPSVCSHPDQIFVNSPSTLGYGQTRTVSAITCDSEQAGVTCTDSSTGHFFRVSRDSYQLG
jgi:hypothetical protein